MRDTIGRFVAGTEPGPGRDTRYHTSMNEQAYRLALLGLTDKQIAAFFGVSETTINNWKRIHPGFLESLSKGKIFADAEVAEGLFRRAVGIDLMEEHIVRCSDGSWQTVQLRRQVPPDPKAALMWLACRQPELWTNRARAEGPPADCGSRKSALEALADEELAAEIERLLKLVREDE